MADFHLFLGEKGGTGKTFFASLLAQYFQAGLKDTCCVDTEQGGSGLVSFRQLAPYLIREDSAQKTAHELVKTLSSLDAQNKTFVIDTPSELFFSLVRKMKQTDLNSLLSATECTLTLHTVVTGGLPSRATLRGLKGLSGNFPETNLAVWCNPFFGNIKYAATHPEHRDQIRTFEQWLVDDGLVGESQLRGLVKITHFRNRNGGNSYDANVTRMAAQRFTFIQATYDKENFHIFQRARLKYVRNVFFRAVHEGLFASEPLPECLLQKVKAPEEITEKVEAGATP